MPANLENSAVTTGLKRLVFTPKDQFSILKKAMPKNVQGTTQLCSFHMLAR